MARMQRLAPAAFLLGAALCARAAAAELWLWTDAAGVVRYTPDPGSVPAERRATLLEVRPGMALPSIPPPAASQAPALYAPPAELSLEADPFNAPEQARALPSEEPVRLALPVGPGAEPGAPASGPVPPAPELPAPEPPSPELPAVAAPPAAAQPQAEAQPQSDAELRARREELGARIAADEERLKELVSRAGGDPSLETSPELREIAQRLPLLQAELNALDEVEAARASLRGAAHGEGGAAPP
jgi:hypothetical protein